MATDLQVRQAVRSATLSELGATALLLIAGSAAGKFRRMVSPPAQNEANNADRLPAAGSLPPPSTDKKLTDIAAGGWWRIVKHTIDEVSADRVFAVAGGVTFYALLSLFPAITVLVSAYGLFTAAATISDHLAMLSAFLPEGAVSIIEEQIKRISSGNDTELGTAVVIGFLAAVWSSNAAMKAMIDALNIAYDLEERRSFVWLNVESLFFTLSAMAVMIAMLAVIALVPLVLHYLPFATYADLLISIGRWPLALAFVLFSLAVLYRVGPSHQHATWRWITPGSLVAAVGLLGFSMAFSWYAANFGKYNETYGSLGAAIAFMTWMWLSASIVLVGAELNAEVEKHTQAKPPA